MDDLKEILEGICTGKDSVKSLKVQLYIIDNSNPCRAQFSYEELESLKEFCDTHEVQEVRFIEPRKDVIYVVAVYRA